MIFWDLKFKKIARNQALDQNCQYSRDFLRLEIEKSQDITRRTKLSIFMQFSVILSWNIPKNHMLDQNCQYSRDFLRFENWKITRNQALDQNCQYKRDFLRFQIEKSQDITRRSKLSIFIKFSAILS